MRVEPGQPRRSALNPVYWLAVAICGICLGVSLYAFGASLASGREELSLRKIIGIAVPLAPAAFAVAGAFVMRAAGTEPSKLFRVGIVLVALWSGWVTLAILGV